MSLISPTVKAQTLSVLQKPTDSITCYVELDSESCNLSLRFEDDEAKLAGYPETWRTWDEKISSNDSDVTYEDSENDGSLDSMIDEIESINSYISRKTEIQIFSLLKKSLVKQFEDEMFKDVLRKDEQEEVLAKIDLAISNL
jgi:hypothetical protein